MTYNRFLYAMVILTPLAAMAYVAWQTLPLIVIITSSCAIMATACAIYATYQAIQAVREHRRLYGKRRAR